MALASFVFLIFGSEMARLWHRASNYNAVPMQNVQKLAEYIFDFARAKSSWACFLNSIVNRYHSSAFNPDYFSAPLSRCHRLADWLMLVRNRLE